MFLDFRVEVAEYRQLEAAVHQFVKVSGQSLKRVTRREARGIMQTVYRYTSPDNQSQGENAVARDLMRVFKPISEALFQTVEDFTGGAAQARMIMRKKDGTSYLVDWDYMSSNPAEMAKFHQSKRISRGRVQHAGSLGSQTRDIGRWKEDHRMVVPHGVFENYLDAVQGRVGIGKSGWLPALNSLGISADSFVTRHGAGNGSVVNRLNNDEAPYFRATNNVDYVAENTRLIDNAVRSRRVFLEAEIEKALQINARASGL